MFWKCTAQGSNLVLGAEEAATSLSGTWKGGTF